MYFLFHAQCLLRHLHLDVTQVLHNRDVVVIFWYYISDIGTFTELQRKGKFMANCARRIRTVLLVVTLLLATTLILPGRKAIAQSGTQAWLHYDSNCVQASSSLLHLPNSYVGNYNLSSNKFSSVQGKSTDGNDTMWLWTGANQTGTLEGYSNIFGGNWCRNLSSTMNNNAESGRFDTY